MSRTFKNSPGPGKDWWGKRPLAGHPANHTHKHWWWKRRLHKIERQQWKEDHDRQQEGCRPQDHG